VKRALALLALLACNRYLPPTEPPIVETGPGGECSGVWLKDPTAGAICVVVEDIAPFIPLILARRACLDGGCLDAAR
jgi:hypothetical protein